MIRVWKTKPYDTVHSQQLNLSQRIMESYKVSNLDQCRPALIKERSHCYGFTQEKLYCTSQRLTRMLKEPALRYQGPFPVLELQVEKCQKKLNSTSSKWDLIGLKAQ